MESLTGPEEHLEAPHQDIQKPVKTERQQFDEKVLHCTGIMNDLYARLMSDWEGVENEALDPNNVTAKVSEYRGELAKVRKFPISDDPWLDIQGQAKVPEKYPYLCQMIANLEFGLYKVGRKSKTADEVGFKGLLGNIPCPFADPEPPAQTLLSGEAFPGSTVSESDLEKSVSTSAASTPDSGSPTSEAATQAVAKAAPQGRKWLPLSIRKKRFEDVERCRKLLLNIQDQLDAIWERILASESVNDEDKIPAIARGIRAALEHELTALPTDIVEKEREWDDLPRLELQLANLEARNFDPTWLDEQGEPLKLNAPRAPLPLSGPRFAVSRSLLRPSDVTPASTSESETVTLASLGPGPSSAGTGNVSFATTATPGGAEA
jgi:hypothetical protein